MNAMEAISPANTDPYSRYSAYQSPPGGMGMPMEQTNPMAHMAQEMIMAGLVLSLLSQILSPQNGGGNPLSGGAQQPADPFQEFLRNLLGPLLQGGGGAGGSGSAGSGGGYDNGGYGDGGYGNGGRGNYGNGYGDRSGGGNGYEPGDRGSSGNYSRGGSGPSTQPGDQPCRGGGSPGSEAPTHTTPSTTIPQANGSEIVNETIVVKAGQVFDGGGKLYKAGPQLGDGGQGEHQKPVFLLEPGATLQNLQVQGADGVHANGDAHLKNVTWTDVGEDAFTLKKPGHVTVEGGGAFNASDKVFQINAPGSISIDGFHAENFDKLVRQNGGTDFPLDVKLSNIETKGQGEALVRTDSSNAHVLLSNVDSSGAKNDVLAPQGADVEGATKAGYKPYTG